MTSNKIKLVPFKRFSGTRLGNYLKIAADYFAINENLEDYTSSGKVSVNGETVTDLNYYLKIGDYIEIESSSISQITPPKLDIIHQDDNICVINKDSGVHSVDAIHPAPWPVEDNVRWITTPTQSSDPFVAAIHRLDVDTSGVLVLATTRDAASILGKAIQNRETTKSYYAVVSPAPKDDKFEINLPIGYDTARPGFWTVNGKKSKEAYSRFEVEKRFDNNSALVKCYPTTGRTHQLRVHLYSCGSPIIGDDLYHGLKSKRLMLHCSEMSFHKVTEFENTFKADLPESFIKFKII